MDEQWQKLATAWHEAPRVFSSLPLKPDITSFFFFNFLSSCKGIAPKIACYVPKGRPSEKFGNHCFISTHTLGTLSRPYLTGNSECVAQLGFSSPKLSKHFGDRTSLNSTCEGAGKKRITGQLKIDTLTTRAEILSAWVIELCPPCRSLSSSLEPVEIWMISALLWWNSVAVVKPMGTSLAASVFNERKTIIIAV